MRSSDIVLVLAALAGGGELACAARAPAEATEVPAAPPRGGEASCRHELGRCGGHEPGDGACRSAAPTPETGPALAPVPLDEVTVEPGGFAEINLEMATGAVSEAAFEATGPLEWNVHSHAGDRVTIHAEGVGTAGDLRFAAPVAGPFSYLWKNAGEAPVRLTVRLGAQGSVRVHSVHPAR